MFCENCGSRLPESYRFCSTCGAPVKTPRLRRRPPGSARTAARRCPNPTTFAPIAARREESRRARGTRATRTIRAASARARRSPPCRAGGPLFVVRLAHRARGAELSRLRRQGFGNGGADALRMAAIARPQGHGQAAIRPIHVPDRGSLCAGGRFQAGARRQRLFLASRAALEGPQIHIDAMPLKGAWKRAFCGMPLIMTQAAGPGRIAFRTMRRAN